MWLANQGFQLPECPHLRPVAADSQVCRDSARTQHVKLAGLLWGPNMATASLCQEQAKPQPSPGVVSPRAPCGSLVFKVWSQMGHLSSTWELVENADSQLPQTCGHWQLHSNKMPHLPTPLGSVCAEPPAGVTRKVSVC